MIEFLLGVCAGATLATVIAGHRANRSHRNASKHRIAMIHREALAEVFAKQKKLADPNASAWSPEAQLADRIRRMERNDP